MGNSFEKEGSLGDGEFVSDTLARDITFRRVSDSNDSEISMPAADALIIELKAKLSPDRPVNFLLNRNRRRQTANMSVASRRRMSFKASARRSPSKASLFKSRRADLVLSDMEVKVVDGNVAKLVPRDSVLQLRGYSSPKERINSLRERKARKTGRKFKDSMKIKSAKQLRESNGLDLSKRLSYIAAISNNDDIDSSPNQKQERENQNEEVKLRHGITFKPAYTPSKRLTNIDMSLNQEKLTAKPRCKSAADDNNNGSTVGELLKLSGESLQKDITASVARLSLEVDE